MNREEIYVNYIGDIYKYSYFQLRNKEQAEDVASETFLRIFEKESLGEIINFKPYLIGTARNIIFDKFKQKKTSSIDELNEGGIEFSDEDKPLEKQVMDEQLIELIKNKLDTLDESTREVLILKIWEDLQFNEIAGIVGEKESTVKLRYYRGIEKLKLELGERKGGKKLYSMSLPLIVAGIGHLAATREFILPTAEISNIARNIGLSANLIFNSSNMDIVTTAGGILSTTGAKIITLLGLTSAVAVSGLLGTAYVISKNTPNPSSYPIGIEKQGNYAVAQEENPAKQNNIITFTKKCENQTLGVSTLINEQWTCKVENFEGNLAVLTIDTGKYEIIFSNLGYGIYCETSEGCSMSQFFKNSDIDLKLYKFNNGHEEIFGIGSSLIQIKNKFRNDLDLTEEDKTTLSRFFSLSIMTKPEEEEVSLVGYTMTFGQNCPVNLPVPSNDLTKDPGNQEDSNGTWQIENGTTKYSYYSMTYNLYYRPAQTRDYDTGTLRINCGYNSMNYQADSFEGLDKFYEDIKKTSAPGTEFRFIEKTTMWDKKVLVYEILGANKDYGVFNYKYLVITKDYIYEISRNSESPFVPIIDTLEPAFQNLEITK